MFCVYSHPVVTRLRSVFCKIILFIESTEYLLIIADGGGINCSVGSKSSTTSATRFSYNMRSAKM